MNQTNDNNGCDESKCVSTGLSHLFNDSFTCYADGGRFPMICADGYMSRVVDKEPLVRDDYYCVVDPYKYFTCCPPNISSNTSLSRHCSNSTSIDGMEDNNNNTVICGDTTKPYPRPMKTRKYIYYDDDDDAFLIESFVCCDSIVNENENDNYTSNFLEETKCVPYNNEFYEPAFVTINTYGMIEPVTCDEPESRFGFPRLVEYNKSDYYQYFECCKIGPGSGPFILDSAFKQTVYPQIAISTMAVISSAGLIVALLMPLFIPILTKLRSQKSQPTDMITDNGPRNTRTRSPRSPVPAYSSYNLYLVYLAIPDLILNLYLLIMYGSYANQKFNPNYYGIIISVDGEDSSVAFEGPFIIACSTANLYLNCVISYEVLILLRNSNQAIRYSPPSLLKVTLQSLAVYLFSFVICISDYFIKAEHNASYLSYSSIVVIGLVTYVFPILFFSYVLITIKCRGYIPSVTGRMKQLVRISLLFCLSFSFCKFNTD
jgi:hypothetical protein